MINRETIDKIMETARIEEVVGDFVHLKKRGSSLIGNCPFHGEKTPSFHVSVSKGIYKCFGCGKGGDSVRFIMEHEKYSYPEALKFLASKYNIEVEETVETVQDVEAQNARESLYIVSQFAANFFENQLWNSQDGKAIGVSYFKERGFREDILKKFNVGYSPDVWDALTQDAITNKHTEEYLEKTGLAIRNDKGKLYDRFRGRVMFPIHNFTGRVIGFGGRTLKTDKNVPKYVNSPESDIYHKSNVLYGLFHAKKSIRDLDNCYLVEGYADVLSVHQANIENVVASSGTSLTIEQIRLIGRFTQNVTILYDGDAAGIKASLRGLDMILEEGLNVKVVSFPAGDDPDSYMHKVGEGAFKTYIEENRKDFVVFKAKYLLEEANEDPILKANASIEIARTISLISEEIKREQYIHVTSEQFKLEERAILNAVKQHLKKKNVNIKKQENIVQSQIAEEHQALDHFISLENSKQEPDLLKSFLETESDDLQEQEIVRLLLTFGHELANWEKVDNMYVGSFIIQNLSDVVFENKLCKKIIDHYRIEIENGHLPTANQFIKNQDHDIADLAITLSTSPYSLSENWYNKHNIYVRDETVNLKATILGGIFHLKKRKVDRMLLNLLKEIKIENDAVNQEILMQRYAHIKSVEKEISKFLGSVILK